MAESILWFWSGFQIWSIPPHLGYDVSLIGVTFLLLAYVSLLGRWYIVPEDTALLMSYPCTNVFQGVRSWSWLSLPHSCLPFSLGFSLEALPGALFCCEAWKSILYGLGIHFPCIVSLWLSRALHLPLLRSTKVFFFLVCAFRMFFWEKIFLGFTSLPSATSVIRHM